MILNALLQSGTVLANVRYKWIAAGVVGSALSAGITQPDATFPVFRINAVAPSNAEEIIVYDSTDVGNWNAGGYKLVALFDLLSNVTDPWAATIPGSYATGTAGQLLAKLNVGASESPAVVVPGAPADLTLCRVYGYFEDLSNLLPSGIAITFTLNTDLPVKSERLISNRQIAAKITNGVLTDATGHAYVDLQRNDNLTPAGTSYTINCFELGLRDKVVTLTTETFDLADLVE